MNEPMKRIAAPLLFLILSLFQVSAVLARNDKLIKRDIEAQVAESEKMRNTRIEVHVKERLVVLAGEVRLYEQKLIGDRIAWTTPGVFEVDNEIQVIPKLSLSDEAIERKIWEIVKANERFRAAQTEVVVNRGEVFLKGIFFDFHDPSVLKYKVSEIEGVVDIKLSAAFIARSRGTERITAMHPRRPYN